MASRWSDRAGQLRRLWRLPHEVAAAQAATWRTAERHSGEVAQAQDATWRAAERLSSELATLSAKLDDQMAWRAEQQAQRLAEQDAVRREVQTIRHGMGGLYRMLAELHARPEDAEALSALSEGMGSMQQGLETVRAELASLHGKVEAMAVQAPAPDLTPRLDAIQNQLESQHADDRRRFLRLEDLGFDQLAILARQPHPGPLRMVAEKPVAVDSADHLHPRGTAADDTRHPRFVAACEALFPNRTLHHLDLGCAGGGLVWDFLSAGHHSYGVEGSDFSQRSRRAYWRVAPGHYFTADITRPFQLLRDDGAPAIFEVVTAWEVLEHIAEADLPGLFGNIRQALTADGVFLASVASFEDRDPATGTALHVTLRPRDWWLDQAAEHGLRPVERPVPFSLEDFARGSGNPRMADWDARWEPSWGFHLMLEATP